LKPEALFRDYKLYYVLYNIKFMTGPPIKPSDKILFSKWFMNLSSYGTELWLAN
jgi:hypothetical protein